MKKLIIIVTIFFITISCRHSGNNSKELNQRRIVDTIKVNSILNKQVKSEHHSYIPAGQWKLFKVNRPWDKEPLFPFNVVWNINAKGEIIIKENDSIIDFIICNYEFAPSGFSSDSVWIMKGTFKDLPINADLEIWIDENKMNLIDQCEDCHGFEFKKMK